MAWKRKTLPVSLRIHGGWLVGNMTGPHRNALVIDEVRQCEGDHLRKYGETGTFRTYVVGYADVAHWWNKMPVPRRNDLSKWLGVSICEVR